MLLRLQNSHASMNAMIREQERTANNLANANTVGYKRDRMFTEVLDEFIDVEGAPQSERTTGQWASAEQGALEKTGNPLDLALEGEGFLVYSDDATGALRYSRAGRLVLDADGTLRAPSGHALEGEAGPIEIPAGAAEITVSRTGEIQADGQPVGRVRVVRFETPGDLQRLDGAAFDAAGMEPLDVEDPRVHQGYVEGSNVDPIAEMTDMIEHFRIFEAHQKLLSTQDQVLGNVTRELGKF